MSALINENNKIDISLNNEIKSHLNSKKLKNTLKKLKDLAKSETCNEISLKVKVFQKGKNQECDHYTAVKTFKDYFEDFLKKQECLNNFDDSDSSSSDDDDEEETEIKRKYSLIISDCGSDSTPDGGCSENSQ